MFQQTPQADGAGKGSVFYRGISALGTAIGIGVAILGTPPIFERTRLPIFFYLVKTWGRGVSIFLTYTFGFVEAVILYQTVKLLFTSLVIYAFAQLAARRFAS